jgi:S1-C subfamily serine protease
LRKCGTVCLEADMPSELMDLSNAIAETAAQAVCSVVAVHTEKRGSSSGVIWESGVIATPDHALRRDEEIRITLGDGRVVPASLAGRDPSTDIAILRCPEATSPIGGVADTATLRAGALALVVGRTRISGPVVAFGVVSLVAPERHSWNGTKIAPYLRLDVGLQPTAVGGVVVDAQGTVIGIATPRFARFGAIALPAPLVTRTAQILLSNGHIPRGFLGVGLQPVRLPDALREKLQWPEKTAAMVMEVHAGGAADKAGIVIGDILVSIGGSTVIRLEDVQAHLGADAIGKPQRVRFIRGGALQEADIVVAERPHGGD